MPLYSHGPDGQLAASTTTMAAQYTAAGKIFSAGTGLLSTQRDYVRFTQMLLNGGTLDGHRVLKAETVKLMFANHLEPALLPVHLVPGWPQGTYGFGYGGAVRVDSSADVPGSVGTFRWVGSATTAFFVDPKLDIAAMYFTQVIGLKDPGGLDNTFQRLVYAALIRR